MNAANSNKDLTAEVTMTADTASGGDVQNGCKWFTNVVGSHARQAIEPEPVVVTLRPSRTMEHPLRLTFAFGD